MPAAQRDVVKPPNLGEFNSNKAANGFLPLTKSAGEVRPSNLSRFMHGDPGGSADMTRQPSPINPPNAGQFKTGDKGMSDANAPAAVQPPAAAVPTNPFVSDAALAKPPSETLRSR